LRMIVDAGGDPFAEAKDSRVQAQARQTVASATFGGLLLAYVDQLRRAKKPSADKVESELERTIKLPFPALWKAPAANVTLDDLVRVTNRLAKAGKWRQAEKTRSYLRAAYSAAGAARGSAGTADLFASYGHVQNVARDLATIDRPKGDGTQTDDAKRALSAAELSAYWKRIKLMPGAQGALLRFHLLTGAQRCEQLARLSARQLDRDAATVTLFDSKGRRKRTREHVVPLVAGALAALDVMKGDAGPHLFTLDGGEHGAVYHTVRGHVARVAAAMIEAGEIAKSFTPGELRITVETRLAAAGVPKEARAHLQSHGLGGVQSAHYDKHTYLDEKREALAKLRAMLDPSSKVVQVRKARG
ncbi:MAG: hypothetical protein ABIR10_16960, partial [Dokdonella sp.]